VTSRRPGAIRAAAAGGVLGPLLFVSAWVVSGALRDGYSPVHDAISRLAERGAPDRWIVTSGMLAFGLGSLLLAAALKNDERLRKTSFGVIVVGLSAIAVAMFPCSEGCPGLEELTDNAHALAAGVNYAAFTAAPLLTAAATYRDDRRFAAFSGAAASFAAAALVIQASGLGANGLWQRIGLTIDDIWMVATSLLFLLRRGPFRSPGCGPAT
jgi:hypothetical membrane protein